MTGPWWRRAAREPLLHFAILGALLFALYALVRRGRHGDDAGDERAAVGERAAIEVGAATVDRLAESFRRAWKREPTRDELAEMTLDYVDDEILYREALAQRLDRDDPAVRRRLIEKMTVMARPPGPPREPAPGELRRWYDQRRHHFHQPARYWFRQIFFDPRTHRAAINADAADALAALRRADQDHAPTPPTAGDPSPLPADADGLTDLQLAHLFGNGFLQSLPALPIGRWEGPLSSTQGVHLVRLTRREPARDPPFDEVAAAVKADWVTARSKGYLDAAASLAPRYRIAIAPDVRRRLQGAPLLAPVLEAAGR
jgi:hypothetical protein